MKFRKDFITNSSSSSYIVAIKKGLRQHDIKIELLKDKKSLLEYIQEYNMYWNTLTDGEDILRLETEEEQIALLANILAEKLLNYYSFNHKLEIGDYNVYACTGSSEDIDIFSNWLYFRDGIKTDNLKIKGFD